VSKLLARLLATAVLWVRSSTITAASVFLWKWVSKVLVRLLDKTVLWVRFL
jgi:hypothetical protein